MVKTTIAKNNKDSIYTTKVNTELYSYIAGVTSKISMIELNSIIQDYTIIDNKSLKMYELYEILSKEIPYGVDKYSLEYQGNTYEIETWEDDGESPRVWGNLFTLACKHSRYTLGDKQIDQDYIWQVKYDILNNDFLLNPHCKYYDYDMEDQKTLANRVDTLFDKHYIWKNLYLYDHSGITINTTGFSSNWDSGKIGIVYALKKDLKKAFTIKRLSAKKEEFLYECLVNEVAVYDNYITGTVYGFTIECEKLDISDSCGGFYGEHKASGIYDHLISYMV